MTEIEIPETLYSNSNILKNTITLNLPVVHILDFFTLLPQKGGNFGEKYKNSNKFWAYVVRNIISCGEIFKNSCKFSAKKLFGVEYS